VKKMSFARVLVALVLVSVMTVLVMDYACAGNVEFQEKVSAGEVAPQMSAYIEQPIVSTIGWSAFLLSSEGWSEGYVGPTYSPFSWVSVGASVGIESHPKQTRFGSSIWMGHGRFSTLVCHEEGGSGLWTKVIVKATAYESPSGSIVVGLHHQSFVGTGPTIEMGPKKVTGWASFLTLDGKSTTVLGLKLNF
jgi:hypothetical protein